MWWSEPLFSRALVAAKPRLGAMEDRIRKFRVMVDEAVVGFARFFGGRHQIDQLERHVAVKVLAMGLRQALNR
jgi:hypothetical protein